MLNMKLKIFIPVFFIFYNVFSQETLIDIEKKYKSKTLFDLDYYEVVAEYAQLLQINNQKEKAIYILERNSTHARKLNDNGNYAYLKSVESIQHAINGDKIKSDNSFKEAKYYVERISNFEIKGYIFYAGGWLSYRNHNEIQAVDYYLKALKYYDLLVSEKKISRRKSIVYNELARIYANWDEVESHEKYTQKTLEYALKQDDQEIIFSAYMAVGFLYEKKLIQNSTDQKSRDLAETNYIKALKIYKENKFKYDADLSYVTINLASLYIKYFPESYKEKAREYVLLAEKISAKNKEPNYTAAILEIKAEISSKDGDKILAKKYINQALDSLKYSYNKDSSLELLLYQKLVSLEIDEDNYKQAMFYQSKYLNTFKEIYDYEKLQASKRLEAEYEQKLQQKEYEKLELIAQKKEQQIQLLHFLNMQKQNEFDNLKLVRDNQTKKLKLYELNAYKKKQELRLIKLKEQDKNKDLKYYQEKLNYEEKINDYYILIIIFGLLTLLLLLFFLRQRTKRMQEKEKNYKLALEKEKQQAKISALTALLDGQEKERERLARDLHDGLGGLLSATKLQLSNLINKQKFKNDSELSIINDHIDFAINKLRKVSHNLMPDLLLKYGIEAALKEFASRMKNDDLEIHVNFLSFNNTLETEKQLFVYRIIQELVSNAIKHAHPSQIIIQLVEEDNEYHITVEDDGIGFDTTNLNFKNSAGFINIQSRIKFLKGTFDIHSEKNLGTSFEFKFPKNKT